MAQITVKLPASLKKRMEAYASTDWNRVIQQLIREELKEYLKIEKTIDRSSVLRTKLMRIPPKVSSAWSSFFERQETRAKKAKRKPF